MWPGCRRSTSLPDRRPRRGGLEVLPNLDVVALGDVPPGDRLVLDAFSAGTSERVWTLSTASMLAAVDPGRAPGGRGAFPGGRAPGELAAFLAERAAHGVPPAVCTLLDDVEARAGRVCDLGLHRVVECA